MKKFLACLLIAAITSCANHEKSSKDDDEIDINKARAACEQLDHKYEVIYKEWLRKNNIEYTEDDSGLSFEYQNGHFYIPNNSNDKEFFNLIMPAIIEIDDNWGDKVVALLEINEEVKCVKCYAVNGKIWLATEILLDQTPEIDVIMPRLLSLLHGARNKYYSKLKK